MYSDSRLCSEGLTWNCCIAAGKPMIATAPSTTSMPSEIAVSRNVLKKAVENTSTATSSAAIDTMRIAGSAAFASV